MAELHIGAEHDRLAQRRLQDALQKAGVGRVGSVRGLLGSQEISGVTFAIDDGRLRIEVETYIGITVSGDDEALEALSRHL